jgi:hypothetical protein
VTGKEATPDRTHSGEGKLLQIIGWLGCVYLLVKGLELASSSAHRTADGKMHITAIIAAVIAFISALIFIFLFNGQASSSPFGSGSTSLGSTYDPSPSTLNIDENLITDANVVDLNATDPNVNHD